MGPKPYLNELVRVSNELFEDGVLKARCDETC